MLSKNFRLTLLLGLFGVTSAVQCQAALSDDLGWSWSNDSDNGKYRFVYVVPTTEAEQVAAIKTCSEAPPYFTHSQEISDVQYILKTYPRTGVYRTDGSSKPVWTTNDPYADGKPSPDGTKVVRFHDPFADFIYITVYEPTAPVRNIREGEVMGIVSMVLYAAAGDGVPYADDYQLDATWEYAKIIWEDGATATVRLDDFAIVQSNTLRYALFNLFTTLQGIAVACITTAVFCGLTYALSRWLLGGMLRDENRTAP